MNNIKYGISEDGKTCTFLYDMYKVADRLLDGVEAVVTLDMTSEPISVVDIKVKDLAMDYFSKLNTEYWYAEAIKDIQDDLEEFAENGDLEEILATVCDGPGSLEW